MRPGQQRRPGLVEANVPVGANPEDLQVNASGTRNGFVVTPALGYEVGGCAVEEADIGTHHGAVGYFLTRSWQLPNDFCRAILWHHDTEVFTDGTVADAVRNFVGIVQLAEHVLNLLVYEMPTREWHRFEPLVLEHFGLADEDFLNLQDEAREILGS